jgi:hypothetical protein
MQARNVEFVICSNLSLINDDIVKPELSFSTH